MNSIDLKAKSKSVSGPLHRSSHPPSGLPFFYLSRSICLCLSISSLYPTYMPDPKSLSDSHLFCSFISFPSPASPCLPSIVLPNQEVSKSVEQSISLAVCFLCVYASILLSILPSIKPSNHPSSNCLCVIVFHAVLHLILVSYASSSPPSPSLHAQGGLIVPSTPNATVQQRSFVVVGPSL